MPAGVLHCVRGVEQETENKVTYMHVKFWVEISDATVFLCKNGLSENSNFLGFYALSFGRHRTEICEDRGFSNFRGKQN
jgi:hypothetical protein